MVAFTQWLTVIALAATPALVLGQSAAAAAGIGFGLDPWIMVPVIALSGFVEGMLLAYLAGISTRIKFVHRWCEKLQKPKAVALANRWGPWGGMFIGVAAVGQEPIIIALRWLGIETRKMWLPTFASNVVFAVLYYWIVRLGWSWI